MAITLRNLKSVGIEEPWQIPLYLPTGYFDARHPISNFEAVLPEGQEVLVCGKLLANPSTEWRNGSPRTQGKLFDEYGNSLTYSLFGDSRSMVEQMQKRKHQIYLRGTVRHFNERFYLNQVSIVEESDVGKLVPVYPGKAGKLAPGTAKRLIHERLDKTLVMAEEKLRDHLGDIVEPGRLREVLACPSWTLGEILEKVHRPTDPAETVQVLAVLERVAALISVSDIRKTCQIPKIRRTPLILNSWKSLLHSIPFTLTGEQLLGIEQLISALKGNTVSAWIVNGDVGMGKSVIYQVAVAYTVSAGGRSAVLLPHGRLARQAHEELSHYWPALKPLLVTGKTEETELAKHQLLVGTTALLHREIGDLDFAVIDEQHRFGVHQRQQLAAHHTHICELSATPIPRSQALLKYGSMNMIQLTKRHSEQDVRTFIVEKSQVRRMVDTVRSVIEKTESRVLIVCAQVDDNDTGMELSSVKTVFDKWSALFPGLVRMAHSRIDADAMDQVFKDMQKGKGRVLVCSTVVETGLTLPDTRVLVVVNADRFGVSQLHQLRGRLSRSGGWGRCYLYLPKPVKEATRERLDIVASTNDGFRLSQLDLELRGAGDLSKLGKKQHGSSDHILFNRPVSLPLLEEMAQVIG